MKISHSFSSHKFSWLLGALCCLFALSAHAASYNWIGPSGTVSVPTTGSWNTAANWSGGLPVSSSATELDFSGAGTYTSTDNISGVFDLNILGLSGTSGTGTIAATSGNSLRFVSNGVTTPTINLSGNGSYTISAPVEFLNNMTVTGATGTTGGMNFTGVVSGAGKLSFNNLGSGALTLSNSNSYSGGTEILKGSFITRATGAIGSGSFSIGGNGKWTINNVSQSYSNAITVASTGGTIDTQTTASLSGDVALGGSLTLRSSTSGAVGTMSGILSGTGSITKNDNTGSWILSKNNSYTGTTTVGGGTLVISGSTSGQGNYTVNGTSTGSGILSGNGTIGLASAKTLTVSAATGYVATLGPSDATGTLASVGTMVVNWASTNGSNKLTLGANSIFAADIGTLGNSDRLVVGSNSVTGAFDLSSASDTLSLNAITGGFDGSSYIIANYFGVLSGTFDTLSVNGVTQASNTSFSINGYNYAVSYNVANVNGGYDIVVAVPEPSTVFLLSGGLLAVALLRKRKIAL